MKYKKWLEEWLNLYVKTGVKPRTYRSYSDITRHYIAPYLGKYDMEDLTSAVLQSHVLRLLQKDRTGKRSLSPSTVGLIITVMQISLNAAIKFGRTTAEYFHHVTRPRIENKRVSCFSLSEQRKIEEIVLLNPDCKNFGIILSLYTGVRIGELLALRWNDIDFEKAIMEIKGTARDVCKNGVQNKLIETPKTASSRRTIPLPDQLVYYLKIIKERSESEFVVSEGESGVTIRSYQRTFTLFLKKLKIPHRGFHSLRHTFATRALECGMDVRTLAELLGHKNPTITLTYYAHSMPEHKVYMMNKLGALLT